MLQQATLQGVVSDVSSEALSVGLIASDQRLQGLQHVYAQLCAGLRRKVQVEKIDNLDKALRIPAPSSHILMQEEGAASCSASSQSSMMVETTAPIGQALQQHGLPNAAKPGTFWKGECRLQAAAQVSLPPCIVKPSNSWEHCKHMEVQRIYPLHMPCVSSSKSVTLIQCIACQTIGAMQALTCLNRIW